MRKIQTNLKLTKTAFLSQLRRRNAFSEKMLSQKPELEQLTWEQRFRAYYLVMDKDERFVFDQIKAVTDGPLLQGNSAILDLLEAHPEMYIELPLFQALNSHLAIWKSKYEKVYQNREDLPIVYVGVEDGVPFPSEIDAQVDEWLTKHSKD